MGKLKRGSLIAFEGSSQSGKSALIDHIDNYYKNTCQTCLCDCDCTIEISSCYFPRLRNREATSSYRGGAFDDYAAQTPQGAHLETAAER